ncbi:hypothetical protein ACFL2X_02770 [Candidatus Latescibacterota bacterium]
MDRLRNLEYNSDWAAHGSFIMSDGMYKEKIVPNSASELTVMLGEKYDFGDIDSDGDEDAAVVLISNPGGSGTFYSLAVVIDDNGKLTNKCNVFLGDRVKINSVSVESGKIIVDMITQGVNDPMFRPSVRVTRTFIFGDANLVEINEKNEIK